LSELYYILRSEHTIPDVDISLSYDVTLDTITAASFSMNPLKIGRILINETKGNQKETTGTIKVDVENRGSWTLGFFLRPNSGLLLLDSKGRAVLRNFGQQVMKAALRADFENVPIYSDYLYSLISDKAIQTHSIKYLRLGAVETWTPYEGEFDWSLLDFHPFVEVNFSLTDNAGQSHDVKITPRTAHVSIKHKNSLSAVSQIIEKHLLGGPTHLNANQIC
jgi:hypothetical protein